MNKNQTVKQETFPVKNIGNFAAHKFSTSLSEYRNELRQNWHRHEDFVLVMILAGHVRERVGRQELLVNPLQVGIKAPGVRHTDHFWSKGVRAIRVTLAPTFVSELRSESLINESWEWIPKTQAVRRFLRLSHFLFNGEQAEDIIYEELCEILAALLPENAARKVLDTPLWMRHALDYLDSSHTEGTRLAQLADKAGVHPVYFARQFRRYVGCSVGQYVRQRQFQTVISLINGKKSLSEIAHQTGFSDQAHLNRTFVGEFGISPGSFRKLIK